jgi:hypothetical protein
MKNQYYGFLNIIEFSWIIFMTIFGFLIFLGMIIGIYSGLELIYCFINFIKTILL